MVAADSTTTSPQRAPETVRGRRAPASDDPRGVDAAASVGDDARAQGEPGEHVVILTGLSGAGKSQASKLFEDLGYYCVDNLPPELLAGFLEVRHREPARYRRVALVLDIRAGDPAAAITEAIETLGRRNVPAQVIYLEAADEALVARFSETRHRHPLDSRAGVQASIAEERVRLAPTRALADAVIDTSGLSLTQLRERLLRVVGTTVTATLTVHLVTFGYKYGLPLDADIVFDVRFLTNPHYVADLRPLSGLTQPVREYVLGQPPATRFLELVEQVIDLTRPAYLSEGKPRLTVAFGCTGGYHRSIVLAEELAARLEAQGRGPVSVFHRELER